MEKKLAPTHAPNEINVHEVFPTAFFRIVADHVFIDFADVSDRST